MSRWIGPAPPSSRAASSVRMDTTRPRPVRRPRSLPDADDMHNTSPAAVSNSRATTSSFPDSGFAPSGSEVELTDEGYLKMAYNIEDNNILELRHFANLPPVPEWMRKQLEVASQRDPKAFIGVNEMDQKYRHLFPCEAKVGDLRVPVYTYVNTVSQYLIESGGTSQEDQYGLLTQEMVRQMSQGEHALSSDDLDERKKHFPGLVMAREDVPVAYEPLLDMENDNAISLFDYIAICASERDDVAATGTTRPANTLTKSQIPQSYQKYFPDLQFATSYIETDVYKERMEAIKEKKVQEAKKKALKKTPAQELAYARSKGTHSISNPEPDFDYYGQKTGKYLSTITADLFLNCTFDSQDLQDRVSRAIQMTSLTAAEVTVEKQAASFRVTITVRDKAQSRGKWTVTHGSSVMATILAVTHVHPTEYETIAAWHNRWTSTNNVQEAMGAVLAGLCGRQHGAKPIMAAESIMFSWY